MRKLKLYLETSAWNFYFADDAPEKGDVTITFFKNLPKGEYEIYASDIVFLEINRAEKKIKEKLEELIKKNHPYMLESSLESRQLAEIYLKRGIIPAHKVEDALHVAIATVAEMDALVTWNYRHLANLKKAEYFHGVNLEQGFLKRLEIITPLEVTSDEI